MPRSAPAWLLRPWALRSAPTSAQRFSASRFRRGFVKAVSRSPTPPARIYQNLRRGIELGFFNGWPLVYDGIEPVAIDAQAGIGKLTRFLDANLVSLRTAHLGKIITDSKDGELAWVSWVTLARQDYNVRFINAGGHHNYPSESYNINTRVIETVARPAKRGSVGEAAYDAASFLVPHDPDSKNRWVSQGVRTLFTLYNKETALYTSDRWPCSPGGLWDFWGRPREEIAQDLLLWAAGWRMDDEAGICCLIAGLAVSPDPWNAYASLIIERLKGFQPGMAARELTSRNSFDTADMKRHRTTLYIIGSAHSETSRTFVGEMTAATIERIVETQGLLRALVVGKE